MVQDAPGFIGVGLGVDFVLALAREVANVRAYKVEALPFWEHARRARLAAGDALSIFGGHGGLYLLDVLEVGADGVIPGSEATAALVRAWRAYAHSDRTDALREYARVLPFLVHAAQSLGLLIGGAKLLLHASGMIATTQARHPEAHLSDTERDRFLDLARRVGLL
jgi:dihydrodipicolinate synthase/N-acetylneuraminate lyase